MKRVRKLLHHFFVPGKHNNHQAHSVSHTTLTAYLVLSIACLSILPNLKYQNDNVLGFATDIGSQALLSSTNSKRIENGLSPLAENLLLTKAASEKAKDMFDKGYWAHFGPSGETPWTFILAQGYDYEYAGENLAKNFLTSEAVVEAWMNSSTHKANILNGNYAEVGFAVVDGNLNGEDTTLVVQMFGKTSLLTGSSDAQGQNSLTRVKAGSQNQTLTAETKKVEVPKTESRNSEVIVPTSTRTPTINLLPAYQFLSGFLVAFLIVAFVVDLYHISKTDLQRHRGKHIAHLIFLAAALIALFMLGRGGVI